MRERLALNGASAHAGEKVVLTGGASQLLGCCEFTANELGRPVRLGRPNAVPGVSESINGPQFAVLMGLASAGGQLGVEGVGFPDRAAFPQGYIGRVGSWLKAGF